MSILEGNIELWKTLIATTLVLHEKQNKLKSSSGSAVADRATKNIYNVAIICYRDALNGLYDIIMQHKDANTILPVGFKRISES